MGGNHEPGHAECRLLGGFTSYLIQFCCGVIAVSSLIIKRNAENPQRPWFVWMLDVSKQLTSALAAHFSGLFNSYWLHGATEGKDSGNECSWYFISFVFDTSLGVYLSYLMLRFCTRVANAKPFCGCCWNPRRSLPRIGDLYPTVVGEASKPEMAKCC